MANKRTLKKCINRISEELFAEALAVSLYGHESQKECSEDLFYSILKMEDNFIRRVSHPEPGLSARAYYKDLKEKFVQQTDEILDQINA